MAAGEITIGNTILDRPVGYIHDPKKLETYDRSINGKLIINRTVTAEDQPVSKYHFEIPGVNNSEMFTIKEETAHIGNLDYIDEFKIMEVLSGDGSTTIFYTQRRMSGDTPVPEVSLGGVSKTVNVTDDTNPEAGNVYAKVDVNGRARFIFGDIPPDIDNNIVIKYEPNFKVHILDYSHIYMIGNVARTLLICEEV
jgi:hypothetical protein